MMHDVCLLGEETKTFTEKRTALKMNATRGDGGGLGQPDHYAEDRPLYNVNEPIHGHNFNAVSLLHHHFDTA